MTEMLPHAWNTRGGFKYIYIYIYIYTHPFTKTLLFQKYISYICMNAEKRLKQGGHTLHHFRGVAITSIFSICINVFSGADKKDTGAEKV